MIVKKVFNQWVYNEQEIIKILEEKGIESSENAIIDYLIEYVINDKKFRKDVLKEMSKNGELRSFYINGSYFIENRILRKIGAALKKIFHAHTRRGGVAIIDSETLIEYLESKKELNQDDIIFLKKIKEYSSSNDIIEKILNRKIKDSITYRDLIYFFMKSSEEFDKSILDDEILGLTISKVFDLLNQEPISYGYSTFISKMNVSELMKNNFGINTEKVFNLILKKNDIEKQEKREKQVEREFFPYYGLTSKFELNPKLKDKIISLVPSHFSTLQKAYCIYRLLCQEFTYDEEYFYLQYCVPYKDHNKFSRLGTLEGGEDVICTGFSLIYAKFLELLGLPFTTLNYDNSLIKKLSSAHIKIRFKVDNCIIDADGAHGLYGSDMVLQKTLNRVGEFKIINYIKYGKIFEQELKEVDEYFETTIANNEYNHAIDMYRHIYHKKNEEYSNLSFLERLDLIKEIILNSKLKFFDMIQLCSNLKKKIMGDYYDKIKIEFIVRKNVDDTGIKTSLNILIAYNETNSLDDDYNANKYIVITPDRQIEELNYTMLKQRFSNSIYDFTKEERNILDLKEEEVTDGREVISRRASR